jgi:imidazolonepropionase-like amidohydrolase
VIFEDVLVFDGVTFVGTSNVVVEGSLVAAVEPSSGRARRTLLPGFIDCHVHLGFFRPSAVLRGGITTARDLGWPLGASLDGGPDVLRAGQILTAPRGYPSRAGWAPKGTAREVRDADDARAAVDEQIAAGARFIKIAQEPRIGPTIAPDVLEILCSRAHERGLIVTSHCGSLEQLELALAAGVDELAHGLWSDEPIPEPMVERLVAHGVVVVPTLHIDPSQTRIDNVRRFASAGGSVVYGTDMGNPPVPGGIDVDELNLLRAAGLSVEDSFAAATSRAASHLGLTDRGRIAPGVRADLVLVDGDAKEDLRVAGVWQAGERA